MSVTPLRVLVTRPWAESHAFAAKLEALGTVPVLAPVMAIEPMPAALPKTPFEAVLVTSAHATAGLSVRDREAIKPKPVFAVGAATAAAMRREGFADVRIAGGDAEAMVDLVRLTHPGRARFLYLCGRERKPALAHALEADGHDLTILESYDAKALAWPPDTVTDLRASPPTACVHFSRRSAALFIAEVRRVGLDEALGRSAQLCLSEDVAAALRSWVPDHIVVAAHPTMDSLLQALATIVAPVR